ncbi:MAG: imidazole glycerol phosphate synthase subunit HisH [Thermomicrobia bacterium]|nr:imidazole glycerol phosphate synthase subunit HisH [Thermomicrobia bacterium]MCA1723901.1 imidazole glycerol phosphate synthase subunit HisH [Thermomicrobia bacterium]
MEPIAILDYGGGNVANARNAFEHEGAHVIITADHETIRRAPGVVLPGVGATADVMGGLEARGLVPIIHEVIDRGTTPFLGICVGLQVLLDHSEEGETHTCLGITPGAVRRLPQGIIVPHMGWNAVRQTQSHPLWDGIADLTPFYFVHSFFCDIDDPTWMAGETAYGVNFASVLARGNVMGTQFHPEKSGMAGLRLLRNFVGIVEGAHAALPLPAVR